MTAFVAQRLTRPSVVRTPAPRRPSAQTPFTAAQAARARAVLARDPFVRLTRAEG